MSVELDEEASISFRDYEKQGIEIGKVGVLPLHHP